METAISPKPVPTSIEALIARYCELYGVTVTMPEMVGAGEAPDLSHHGIVLQSSLCQYPCQSICIHSSPPILTYPGFLSPALCSALIRSALNGQGRQQSPGSGTYQTLGSTTTPRTSTGWFMGRHMPCVSELLIRLEALTGCSASRFEVAQVIRYRSQQEYGWHLDVLPDESAGPEGNRIATCLIYLNTISPSGGGETTFRDLDDVHVTPVEGTLLLFFPSFGSGQPDFRTVHCSKPLTAGSEQKFIAQVFIRERPFAGGFDSIPGY